MYLGKSLIEGLGILGFDKTVIKRVAREKSLEEIFLSTLFLNYILVLIAYFLGILLGGFSIDGRALNMPVVFGLLMVYPFAYNVLVYVVYGFFGLMAESIKSKHKVKQLISVGFHTAIVYSVVLMIIAVLAVISVGYGALLLTLFLLYFIYTMFLSISTIYEYSFGQTLIVIFTPLLVIGLVVLLGLVLFPQTASDLLLYLFI